jgi:hypothetical protein
LTPPEIIFEKIRARYSTPERRAYLYLYLLRPEANRELLIPEAADILSAWIDEGSGLAEVSAPHAIERTSAAGQFRTARPTSPHERRLAMARIVTLVITQQAEHEYHVALISRSFAFAPKGERRALEIWRPAEGSWYSAPVGRE